MAYPGSESCILARLYPVNPRDRRDVFTAGIGGYLNFASALERPEVLICLGDGTATTQKAMIA